MRVRKDKLSSRNKQRLIRLLCVILFTLTGCWNHRELTTMAIVAGAGVDFDDESGKYIVTVQVVMPSASKESSGSGGTGQARGVAVVTGTGYSVFEAVRSMTTELSRKPYWPHNQIVVIGDSLARKGIRPVLDLFLRDPESRPTTWLLVSPGQAREIIAAPLAVEKIPAFGIADLMGAVKASSLTVTATLHEFVARMVSGSTAPIAPRVSVFGDKGDRVRALGTAVFNDDKLVGEMNEKETRGILWVTGKVGSGIISVTLPAQKGTASVEIIRSTAQITAEKHDGKILVRVNLFMEGNLGTDSVSFGIDSPGELDLLGSQVDSVIGEEITAAISKARNYHTDVFGFGSAIEREFPTDWEQLKSDWDQQFGVTEVMVNIQVNIRRMGLINRPVRAPE